MNDQEAIEFLRKKQAEIEASFKPDQSEEPEETSLEKAFSSLFGAMKAKEAKLTQETDEFKKSIPDPISWGDKVLKIKRYHPKHDELCQEAFMFFWDWFFKRDPRCLTIAGESGVGKTLVLSRLYAWCGGMRITAWEKGGWKGNPPLIWKVYWPDLVSSYQDQGRWDDLLPSLSEPSLLFIDDVGKESDRYKSGDNKRILLSVLSHRQYKWTFITTNKHPSNFPKDWDFATEDRLYRNGGQAVNLFGVDSYNVNQGIL